MNQILQSDWFRERAEFSDLDHGQRNVNNKKICNGFLKPLKSLKRSPKLRILKFFVHCR